MPDVELPIQHAAVDLRRENSGAGGSKRRHVWLYERHGTTMVASMHLVRRHPLVAYFILAYALTWLIWIPLILIWPALPFVVLAALGSIAGPTVASHMVIRILGVTQHRKRRRIGVQWYLVATFGPLTATVLGSLAVLGTRPLLILLHQPGYLALFLLLLPIGALFGPLGEEPGWRGFALPRLQHAYGPLRASLILGPLWACWHLPLFLIPGVRVSTHAHAGWWFGIVIAFTICMTWVYNNTGGSLLIAIMMHAALNLSVGLLNLLVNYMSLPDYDAATAGVLGVAAVLLIALTKGRLSYHSLEPALQLY